jgi:hypothetical protein
VAVCKYHPDRAGVGVCMRCRAIVCAACTTRLDGINHCHACLRSLATRSEETRGGGFRRGAATTTLFLLGWLPLLLLFYLLQGRLAP